MSPEELMRQTDSLVVEMHAANVVVIHDTRDQRTPAEQNKMLGEIGRTSQWISLSLLANTRARTAVEVMTQKLSAFTPKALPAMVTPAANENQTAAREEQEMDDDSGRTPERATALYAEIQRRLDALAARREGKSLGRRHALVADRGPDAEPAAGGGGSPTSPG
jgi:hypothetical protein